MSFSAGGKIKQLSAIVLAGLALMISACASDQGPPPVKPNTAATTPDYLIGPGDTLQIFVWRNQELSVTVPVRPDGRISIPLVEDLQAAGKSPTSLARDIEKALKVFIQEPVVTVIVTNFVGPFSQQVRVIGEAANPQAIPYRENMTVLDVMIAVGGLTQFAAGNRAVLVRTVNGKEHEYRVNIDKLIKDGDLSANVGLLPGDVLIIPQSWF